ncbi:hypothetical protein AOL_s00075g45 [Orbilia oligospora ATCC 24927]|uniref:VOC domain-containing protein n=2 Tax=Orbilia oligospora TaxID=2813651 RepID=G1X846_ARTOA|nr:hypothetical protein AOL_s00075g45 [Orbilia oligospora ATCC 24927]EGX50619.1 hypothetical protein AOL_s00075g45 [Orbilia oligospora ATCC 24927]KAF3282042.1 hypothetical protein TWF970_001985 [Orbilia oligospora]
MLQKILFYTSLLLTPLLTTAHIPYLDSAGLHNSYTSAFQFHDNTYSRALCTTTYCPPRYFQPPSNSTNATRGGFKRPRWTGESWSKVFLSAGEDLHFEFGVPNIPALEFPSFRPTVYLLGRCLPSPRVFGHPQPQFLENPGSQLDLPRGCKLKGLRFHLSDPGWEATKFYEKYIGATFLRYLDYTVPVGCDGEVYIVVKGWEKRVTEYYVSVGKEEQFPPYESTDGIAKVEDVKKWANGEVAGVGKFCQRRGIWERE